MILNLMKIRSSVRDFDDKEIPDNDIETILESARLSPSGGNEQSYVFGLIKDKNSIKQISEIAYNQKWIQTAKILIVLCVNIVDDDRGGRNIQLKRFPEYTGTINEMDKTLYSSLNIEEHQTKIPGSVMMLQALELGIHSTWISLFRVKELQKFLNLPYNCIPSEILAFGYPKKDIKLIPKKDLKEILFYEKYNLK